MPLFDYNKAGKGISKNEPEKRAFFKFFDIFGRKFWKLLYLNFVYLLFCLPIVTIGPATAAMMHVMRKFVLEQPIFLFSEFLDGFRKNFKQAFIIGIIDIILTAVMAYTVFYYFGILGADSSMVNTALFAFSVAVALFYTMMKFYIYPQVVALTLGISSILKNSFLLAVIGVKRTLVCLVITVTIVGTMLAFYPFSLLVIPILPAAWLGFCNMFICYPVIQNRIINPYYAAKGERNPEIPDYLFDNGTNSLFEDFGGREEAIKGKKKPTVKGKVIR